MGRGSSSAAHQANANDRLGDRATGRPLEKRDIRAARKRALRTTAAVILAIVLGAGAALFLVGFS